MITIDSSLTPETCSPRANGSGRSRRRRSAASPSGSPTARRRRSSPAPAATSRRAGPSGPAASSTAPRCWRSTRPATSRCWPSAARGRAATWRSHVTHFGVHDHGFNNVSTYGNLRRLILEGRLPRRRASSSSTTSWPCKASAAVQASRWSRIADGGGYIYSFNGPHSLFSDTMRSPPRAGPRPSARRTRRSARTTRRSTCSSGW